MQLIDRYLEKKWTTRNESQV